MSNPQTFRDRGVFGPFGDVGYIAKKPGHGIHIQKRLEKISVRDAEDDRNELELRRIKGEEIEKCFWARSDVRSLNAHVKRLVEAGMKAHEDDLIHKKNRLKLTILKEESDLTEEYIDKAQKTADVEYEKKKKKAIEIENRAANFQETFVKKAYERIFKENCDELRAKVLKENRKAINEIHLKQIEIKRAAIMWEKEDDKLWVDMESMTDELRAERSALEASAGVKKSEEYVLALKQQLKDRERCKTNTKCLERWEESYRTDVEKLNNLELSAKDKMDKNNQEIYNNKLLQQLEVNRLMKRRSEEEEKSFGKILIQEDIKAAQREKDAIIDTRAQQRKELITFKESLRQYREATTNREKELEAITSQQFKEFENKQMSARHQAANARRNLLISCVEDRKRRIVSRKEANELAKRNISVEDEFGTFKIKENVDPDLNKMRFETTKTIDQEAYKANVACAKYNEMRRDRERLFEEKTLNKAREEDKIKIEKIEELLGQPLKMTSGLVVHPFVNLLLRSK